MTNDEIRIHDITNRVRLSMKDGMGEISQEDFEYLIASLTAWKFTAKCFATAAEHQRQ